MISTQRLGRFRIQRRLVSTKPNLVRRILGDLIVVHCEMRFDTDTLDYVAIGDCFEPIPIQTAAPEYDVELTADGGFRFCRK